MNSIHVGSFSNNQLNEENQEDSSGIGLALMAITAAGALATTTFYAGYNWYTRIMLDRLSKNLDKWCDKVKGSEEYEWRRIAKEKIINCYKNNSHTLRLTDLGLTFLPDEIGQLRSVTTLELAGNQLRELPATIGQLRSLEILNANWNQLQTLPVEIGALKNLKELLVFDNQLQELPASIGRLISLTTLNAEKNQLQILPAEIGELRNLRALLVCNNQLQELPATIGRLEFLITLDAGGNLLQTLPVEIGELRSLLDLLIYQNQLRELPTSIGELQNLINLNLRRNQISSLANLAANYSERSLFSSRADVILEENPIVNDDEAYHAFQVLINRMPAPPDWAAAPELPDEREPQELPSLFNIMPASVDSELPDEGEPLEIYLDDDDRAPLEMHFEDFSKYPIQTLIHLSEAMTENAFPKIEYINSPGQDVTGMTRDCITRLFYVLFDPNAPSLPMKSRMGKEKYTPMILPEATIPLKEQILCYQAIGKIFALAIIGYKSINTGPYFEPIVFAMIHSLSEKNLSTLPENIDVSNVKEFPKEVFEKLFTIYAEKVLGWNSATIANSLNGQFQDDETLQLACLSSIEDVYACYSIDKIIPAVLMIGKAMYDYRKVLDKEGARKIAPWDKWKRVSGDALMWRIEGKLEKKDLLTAIEWHFQKLAHKSWKEKLLDLLKTWVLRLEPCHETTKGFLEQWIQQASDEQLRKFLWALTGKSTLLHNRKLIIELEEKGLGLPVFHSCFGKMDLSCKYANYEAFKKVFEFSIEEAVAQGFSLA